MMRQALALGALGGAAIAGVAFIISAGGVFALMFGLLAGVPALVLAIVATGTAPRQLADIDDLDDIDDEPSEWEAEQPRLRTAACCSPLRYDPLTMIRRNSYTYDLARVTASEPDELDDIDDLDELDDWRDDPEELPLVVPNWPTRQTVEPDPVPVVVGRTAARFSNLEIGGKR